ncbi:hypothetical protein M413DRAFT_23007 [Hebeloma cylindrosporum]|uniref:Uncharacterized protein n=1 Tax=Hebeloma cylindrosporum TaxID=76867 RepID=A0A0C2Z0B6_HEBCY|nr:hypothetical protein M413DRAFT_23007 [Hebeloma cylindrosporum h7]
MDLRLMSFDTINDGLDFMETLECVWPDDVTHEEYNLLFKKLVVPVMSHNKNFLNDKELIHSAQVAAAVAWENHWYSTVCEAPGWAVLAETAHLYSFDALVARVGELPNALSDRSSGALPLVSSSVEPNPLVSGPSSLSGEFLSSWEGTRAESLAAHASSETSSSRSDPNDYVAQGDGKWANPSPRTRAVSLPPWEPPAPLAVCSPCSWRGEQGANTVKKLAEGQRPYEFERRMEWPLVLAELRRKFDLLEHASRTARDMANVAERAHDNVDMAMISGRANNHRQMRIVLERVCQGYSEGASLREVLRVILKRESKDWEFPAKDQEMVDLLSMLSFNLVV